MTKKIFYVAIVAIAIAALLGISRPMHSARKPAAAAIPMNSTDIAGVVTSSKGPEAGVWVIAETKDLGTGYRKIVVTDDQGRYLVPIFRKRTTPFGCAAMGWWIRRRFRSPRASPWI